MGRPKSSREVLLAQLPARFWSKVDRSTGCWNWKASLDRRGYGKIGIEHRTRQAHRVAWELKIGPILRALFVCHHCDNPKCVRPSHLFLGTAKDNMQDMLQKCRQGVFDRSGENNGNAKLNIQNVQLIRKQYSWGVSSRALASEYGVSQRVIQEIVRGAIWR